MIVLKIIGWVLLGILALVIIALCIKLRIDCEYSEEHTFVMLQWLFVKIPLYPKDKKKDGGEEEESEDDSSEDEEEEEEKPDEKKKKGKKKESLLHMIYRTHGVDGTMLLIRRLLSYTGTFLGDLLRAVIVENFSLDVRCSKGDAAETAIYYGEVCSAVFPPLGALVSKYRVKDYDINIYPDYLAKYSTASFAICFFLRPIRVIWVILVFVFRLIFKVLLGMFVKIFLSAKNGSTEKQNKKISEKRDDSK